MSPLTRRSGWVAALLVLFASAATSQVPPASARPNEQAAVRATTSTPPRVTSTASPAFAPGFHVAATAQDIKELRDDVREMQVTIKADIATMRPAWWERLSPPASAWQVSSSVGSWARSNRDAR